MRSSTLYGPVTKVTAGKYFAQVANKGLDKTGKEKASKGHGKWKCGEKEKTRRRAEHQEEGKNTSPLWTMRREDVPHSTHTVPLPCICTASFPFLITSSFFHAHSTIAPIAMLSLALIHTNTPSGHFVLCGMDLFLLFLCTKSAQCDFGLGTTAVYVSNIFTNGSLGLLSHLRENKWPSR